MITVFRSIASTVNQTCTLGVVGKEAMHPVRSAKKQRVKKHGHKIIIHKILVPASHMIGLYNYNYNHLREQLAEV